MLGFLICSYKNVNAGTLRTTKNPPYDSCRLVRALLGGSYTFDSSVEFVTIFLKNASNTIRIQLLSELTQNAQTMFLIHASQWTLWGSRN